MKKFKSYEITPKQLVEANLSQENIEELFDIPNLSRYEKYGIKIIGIEFILFSKFDVNELANVVQLQGSITEENNSIFHSFFVKGIDFNKPLPMTRIRKGLPPKILGGTKRTPVFNNRGDLLGYYYVVVQVQDEKGNDIDKYDIALGSLHNEPQPADDANFTNEIKTIIHQVQLQINNDTLISEYDIIMNFLNEWYPNRTLPERKEIIDGLKITNTNKPISRKVFPCPNDVFGEWIDSKCIIKYPHPDEKKDGEKVCDELDDYIFYSSVGSFDRSFFRMLRKYLSKDNQDRKKPRGCRLIFAASFKNGKVHDVMKSRNKGLIEIKSHLQELQILNKLSNPKNTELDFSWFKLEGYRLNTEEEMTKTHIDRLVTAEEVETYMKKHRGKKR